MAKANCEFKGTGGEYFGTVFIHLFILGTITFGIYCAWAWVRVLKLKASHTLIDGKKVSFQGTGGELFGLVLIQGFLTFLTFGFYGPWAFCRYFDWRAENTLVEDTPSQFTGTGGSLFLLYLVHLTLLPIITLGLYYFWGLYRLYAWKEENTKYGGEETSFGAGFGEFIKVGVISWILNTVTLNIFMPWSLCMLYRWQVEGLAVGDPDKVEHFPPVKTNTAVVIILVVIGLFFLSLAVFLAKKAVETTMRQAQQLAQFQQMQAQVLQKRKRLKIAEEETPKPLFLKPKEGPGETENKGALGRLKWNVADYTGAKKRVQGRIKKSPGNAEAHYDLAWLYGSRLQLDQAVGEYTKAIQMNNRFVDAYYNRGLVYAAMGEFKKAVEDFTSTIKLNPAAVDGYCNRGNAYFALGRADKALSDFKRALRISPSDGDVLYDRALVYEAQGDVAKARNDLRKAVASGHESAERRLNELEDVSLAKGSGWRMNLKGVHIPSGPAGGRIHGDSVTIEKAIVERGMLTLRDGKKFFPDHAFTIFLFLKKGETVENRTFEYSKESGFGSPHVHMKWKQGGKDVPETKIWMKGYAMLLQFGKRNGGEIPGKIYLCIPDEMKSFIAGSFNAQIKS